jgi:prepilin-type N-terminal cleavage/methylation domain-containing protein
MPARTTHRPSRRRLNAATGRAVVVPMRGGFSMVELVVVLAIVSVLAGVGTVRFAGAISRSRADAAAARLAADLSLAQARARSTSRWREVTFATGGSAYTLQGEPTATSGGAAYLVDLTTEPYRARITGVTFGTSVVAGLTSRPAAVFDGFGTPAWGVRVDIAAGDQRRRVTLEAPSGRLVVETIR